jgi:hypothetical protein
MREPSALQTGGQLTSQSGPPGVTSSSPRKTCCFCPVDPRNATRPPSGLMAIQQTRSKGRLFQEPLSALLTPSARST